MPSPPWRLQVLESSCIIHFIRMLLYIFGSIMFIFVGISWFGVHIGDPICSAGM